MSVLRKSCCLWSASVGNALSIVCMSLPIVFLCHEPGCLLATFLLNSSINAMHPKTRKILQLLRLRQVGATLCYPFATTH
jgi:hypothetical protein